MLWLKTNQTAALPMHRLFKECRNTQCPQGMGTDIQRLSKTKKDTLHELVFSPLTRISATCPCGRRCLCGRLRSSGATRVLLSRAKRLPRRGAATVVTMTKRMRMKKQKLMRLVLTRESSHIVQLNTCEFSRLFLNISVAHVASKHFRNASRTWIWNFLRLVFKVVPSSRGPRN